MKIKDYVVFSEDFSEAVQVSFALSRHDWSELQKSEHWHFVERFLAAKERKSDEWFQEDARHTNKTPIETSKALRDVGISLGTKVDNTDIEDRTKYLEGITYYEWKKISTAVNRYFDEQIRESQKKMKLTESERVNQLIHSQFG